MFGIGIPELILLSILILIPIAIVKFVVYKNWQENKFVTFLCLFISTPAGLYLLWKYSTFSTLIKVCITILFFGLCIVAAH